MKSFLLIVYLLAALILKVASIHEIKASVNEVGDVNFVDRSALGTVPIAVYSQYLHITRSTQNIYVNYTIDSSSMNFLVTATCAPGQYIAVGLSSSMQGDTIVGMPSGVVVQNMNGHPTPINKPNSATYLTNSWYYNSNGYCTVAFSRTLTAPASGDYALSLNGPTGSMPMCFAVGPVYKHHTYQTSTTIPIQVSSTLFVPASAPFAPYIPTAGPVTTPTPPSASMFSSHYAQTLAVIGGSYTMYLSYTIDSTSINFLVTANCLSTDYISVGFSMTMNGDAVVGTSTGVQAQIMSGHGTPVVKTDSNTYFTNSWYSYCNGYATMAFSRSLTAPGAGDFALSLASGSIPMSFAVGPVYQHHYVWMTSSVPFQVSAVPFVPLPTPTASGYCPSSVVAPTVPTSKPTPVPSIGAVVVASDGSLVFNVPASSYTLTYSIQNEILTMKVMASCSSTDYISIGFTNTPNMMSGADTIVGSSQGVTSYNMGNYQFSSFTAKPITYLTTSSYSYDSINGIATLKFSRMLNTGSSNDISIDISSGVVNMIFATGPSQPQLGDHLANRWATDVPMTSAGLTGQTSKLIIAWVKQSLPFIIMLVFALLSYIAHRFESSIILHQIKIGNFSIGEICFWITFFGSVILFVILDMKVLTISIMTGKLSVMILALTLCPISRTSLWVKVFNVPLERGAPFHIILGILTIIICIIHLAYSIVQFGVPILTTQSVGVNIRPIYGLVALVAMVIMASLGLIRRNYWEIFLYTHKVCAAITIGASLIHALQDYYYFLIPVLFYAVDLLNRYIESFKVASVTSLQVGIDVVTLRVKPSSSTFLNFEPGSYAFICIPSIGGQHGREWHPFSIASAPSDPILTFHIKNMGEKKWTGQLYKLALEKSSIDIEKKGKTPRHAIKNGELFIEESLPVYLYGPYGSLNVNLYNSEQVVLFAGGIGITPFLSIFEDLMIKKRAGELYNIGRVQLIWISKENPNVEEELLRLRNEVADMTEFKVSIYRSRPIISDIFNQISIYDKSIKARSGKKTSILVCGPSQLVEHVERESKEYNYHFHKETFEL